MGVNVDSPGDDVFAGGVDHVVGWPIGSPRSQGSDLVPFYEDVRLEASGMGDNETILDKD
jgi:hypothetical protein